MKRNFITKFLFCKFLQESLLHDYLLKRCSVTESYYLSFFLGGPIGGICCVAKALNASATR